MDLMSKMHVHLMRKMHVHTRRLPTQMNKRHLATVGMLGSIGFTMSLLLVDKSVSGALAIQGKLAVILASSTAALLSAGIMSR
jgi:Na+/H+ antiporter NhaA